MGNQSHGDTRVSQVLDNLQNLFTISGSSALVGSSNSMICGSMASALAMAIAALSAGQLCPDMRLFFRQADQL